MTGPLVLGVDGGGTKTVAWLADGEGHILGRGSAGPSNAKTVGADAARRALNDAIDAAFTGASRGRSPVAVACLGLAGFDRPEDRHLLESWSQADDWGDRLRLVNDGELLLAAGTPEGFGVGLIAGTGSIAVGQARDGRAARAGGWGPVYSDEGSAYDVALAGLRLAARRFDGREGVNKTGGALTARLCEAIGVDGPGQFVAAIYSGRFDRAALAGLAPAVIVSADDDPEVRTRILAPAGRALGEMVLAVARSLGWDDDRLPLAKAGGFLLGAAPIAAALRDFLRDQSPWPIVATEVAEPVRGAVLLACRGLAR